jgi:hypothetical protein
MRIKSTYRELEKRFGIELIDRDHLDENEWLDQIAYYEIKKDGIEFTTEHGEVIESLKDFHGIDNFKEWKTCNNCTSFGQNDTCKNSDQDDYKVLKEYIFNALNIKNNNPSPEQRHFVNKMAAAKCSYYVTKEEEEIQI